MQLQLMELMMPLLQSIKDQISTELGVPFDKIDEYSHPQKKAVYSNRLLSRMFPDKTTVSINDSVLLSGRGYVKIGEGISAKKIDQRNMEILNRW